MVSNLKTFFSTQDFMPHGHCYLWKPALLWLHVISDSTIALAYFTIPIVLVYFVIKKEEVPYHNIFLLFGAFIVACGTTHLMEIWTLWEPDYWISGAVKLITAVISLFTVFCLIPVVPQALALKSPHEIKLINEQLQAEMADKIKIEKEMKLKNEELERMNNLMVNREQTMIEMKNELESLRQQLNKK